jgi:predicted metal-dependent peptidase
MDYQEVMDLLRFARAYSADRLPWFSPALYMARIVLTKKVPVAAIDVNMNVYFNPIAVAKMKETSSKKDEVLRELGFLWIHEISHAIRDHADRAKDRNADAELWNIAADLEINDSVWDNLTQPKAFMGIVPKDFNQPEGKLTEWYYGALMDKSPQTKQKKKELLLVGYNLGDEGSGVHGKKRDWEEAKGLLHDENDPNTQHQKLHPIELEVMRREVAEKMHENRKLIGKMAGSWDVWLEGILKSRIDWKKKLRHRMSVAIATGMGARVDYSFARPNRRQSVYFPAITPSFSGDRSARVACVVDTSGSMSSEELSRALGEVFKVLEDFKIPVTVIPCDSKAYEPIVFNKSSDLLKVQKLSGGGGTDMTVGLRAAMALKPVPDAVLVLTDGWTPYPTATFKTQVVFGILKRNYNDSTPLPTMPPWRADNVVDILI